MINSQHSLSGAPSETTISPRGLDKYLLGYWWILAAVFGVACLCVFYRGYVLHLGYPYNTFLFNPEERFSDWTDHWQRFQYFGQERFYAHSGFHRAQTVFPYPPLLAVIMRVPFLLPENGSLAVLVTVEVLGAGIFSFRLGQCLIHRGIRVAVAAAFATTALVTSYPLMFAFDRGSSEGFVWIVLSLGLIAFVRQRWWWAATFFGLAAAMKYFPAVLFALLLSRKKWRHAAFGIGVAMISTVLSCWIMGITLATAYHIQTSQLKILREGWVLLDRPDEIGFQHSLFSVIRQIAVAFHWSPDQLRQAYFFYLCGTAIAGLVLYFLVIRKRPILNQIIALSVCCVLLPALSGDYALLHLYIPWALLVLWMVDHGSEKGRRVLLLLLPFVLIFTPQPYLSVQPHFGFGTRGFSGQVKAGALLVLLFASLCVPLPDVSLDSDRSTDVQPRRTSEVSTIAE